MHLYFHDSKNEFCKVKRKYIPFSLRGGTAQRTRGVSFPSRRPSHRATIRSGIKYIHAIHPFCPENRYPNLLSGSQNSKKITDMEMHL